LQKIKVRCGEFVGCKSG